MTDQMLVSNQSRWVYCSKCFFLLLVTVADFSLHSWTQPYTMFVPSSMFSIKCRGMQFWKSLFLCMSFLPRSLGHASGMSKDVRACLVCCSSCEIRRLVLIRFVVGYLLP